MQELEKYGKLPPQATDLEKAILGALIIEPEAYLKIEGLIKVESFYKNEHGIVFEAIKSLNDKSTQIDLLTVQNKLKEENKLDQVGGVMFMMDLISGITSSYHIESHARIVAQKYMQRELIRISSEIQNQCYDETQDIDDILNFAQSQINDIDSITSKDGKTTKEVALNAMKEIETDAAKIAIGETSGIPTGFETLDNATGGWKSPNFVVIGARPSIGKTTEAVHFAVTAAKEGFNVDLYTYEQSSTDLFKIVLAGESQVNRSSIRDGKIEQYEWEILNNALSQIDSLPITWYDNPNIKANQIRSNSYKNKPDLVIIDYLQLIPPESNKDIREQQISKISRTLKNITTTIKIPVIALSQLSREIEKRSNPEPQLSDLRESGSLEQDADIVMFIYGDIDPETSEVINRYNKIAKNRRGKIGQFEIYHDGQMSKLSEYPISKENISNDMPVNNGFEGDVL